MLDWSFQICRRCRKLDRRELAYGRGWYWWPAGAVEPGMIVLQRTSAGDWCRVQCPDCKGRGVMPA